MSAPPSAIGRRCPRDGGFSYKATRAAAAHVDAARVRKVIE
jgi:hypothetical protein